MLGIYGGLIAANESLPDRRTGHLQNVSQKAGNVTEARGADNARTTHPHDISQKLEA
jgi:hypothetical protein